jgi:hypothetical protein
MNARLMNRNPLPTYSPADDSGAAPAAAPVAEAAPVPEIAAEAEAPAAAKPTLLGGDPPSPNGDPSPTDGEGGDTPADGEAAPEGEAEDKSGEALDVAAIKAPEGFEALDADAIAAIEPELRKLGVDTAKAQEMVDLAGKVLPALIQRQVAAHEQQFIDRMEEQHAEWVEACQSDPEIGGSPEKLARSTADARRFRDQFCTPGVIDILEGSKLGDHPEMVRLFARAGRALAEDVFHTEGGATTTPKTAEQLLYAAEFQAKGG